MGESVPSSVKLDIDTGTLQVLVQYVFHSAYPTLRRMENKPRSINDQNQTGKLKLWTQSRETNLEVKVMDVLRETVPLEPYPKCLLQVHVTVLQDDCSIPLAALTAVSLALMDANIELYDVICASSVVVDDGTILADPNLDKQERCSSCVSLAVLPNR